jgi:hypothetical protein
MLFIFGINWRNKDISLARDQMAAIKANMPKGSVLSIELGNEVGKGLRDCYSSSSIR